MKPQIDTTRNPNLIILDPVAHSRAAGLAIGTYQLAILNGSRCISGADLKGKAKKYGGHYARSRGALFARMSAADIPFQEVTGAHGKRILVIG